MVGAIQNKPFFNQVSYLTASKSTQITLCKVYQHSCMLSYSRWSLLFKNHSCWKHRRVQAMNGIVYQTFDNFYSCQLGCDSVRHITDNAQRHSLSADANAHHMKCILQPLFQKIQNGCHSSHVLNACWGTSVSPLLLALSPCFHVRLC